MRKDCKVTETCGKDNIGLRAPQIKPPCYGSFVRRGDMVVWQDDKSLPGVQQMGRVIGFVTAHNLNGTYLVVARFLRGLCDEFWVDPATVIDCYPGQDFHGEKMAWLFGPDFLKTPVDVARQCYEYTVEGMKARS